MCLQIQMNELTAGDRVLLHDEAEEKGTWRGKPSKVTAFMDLAQVE
jgi:hypothetical protein